MSLEETVVKAAEAAVDAAIEATASAGDAHGERLEAMAAKLSAAARAGVKKARAEAKAAPVRVKKEAEPAPKRAKVKPSPDSSLNIRVRDQTGEEIFFKVTKTTKLEAVFNPYSQRKGVDPTRLRFFFKGLRVPSTWTPQDIDLEDGDQLEAMLEQRGDIGTFGDHAGSPGLAFLQPGAKLDDAPAAVVREIAARCRLGGSEGDAPYFASFQAAGLLSAAQRAALRSELDLGARAADGALDFKKPLTRREASSRLGAKVYGSLEALFRSHGGRVDKIVLRRSAALGQCIKFHTDVDHKTFQLCLNDDFDGGDLVFAADDKFVKPRRPAGSYTVHNDRVAHGVSTLEHGARYALFFLMRAP